MKDKKPLPRPPWRPLKGDTPRVAPIRMLVERWAKEALLDDAREGESQADTFQRWAAEKRNSTERA